MITLTILCENSVGHSDGLLGEHGFAVMVEKDGQRVLFDTGQGKSILNNAAKLGVSLKNLDSIILSHGHWDHAGGLHEVLLLNPGGVDVHIHPDAFVERYYVDYGEDGSENLRFAGIRFPKVQLESFGARFRTNRDVAELPNGMILTGEIPRKSSFEKPATRLRVRKGESIVPDDVVDEQSLLIRGNTGLIIITGCSHPGIVNTINYAMEISGMREIEAIIGGTHLMFQDDDQLAQSVEALQLLSPHQIGTTHCTGSKATSMIRHQFPDQFLVCNVGTQLTF